MIYCIISFNRHSNLKGQDAEIQRARVPCPESHRHILHFCLITIVTLDTDHGIPHPRGKAIITNLEKKPTVRERASVTTGSWVPSLFPPPPFSTPALCPVLSLPHANTWVCPVLLLPASLHSAAEWAHSPRKSLFCSPCILFTSYHQTDFPTLYFHLS
jgi:hypothetical protein